MFGLQAIYTNVRVIHSSSAQTGLCVHFRWYRAFKSTEGNVYTLALGPTFCSLTHSWVSVAQPTHTHTHIGDYFVSVLLFLSDKHTRQYILKCLCLRRASCHVCHLSPLPALLLCNDAMAHNCASLLLLLKVIRGCARRINKLFRSPSLILIKPSHIPHSRRRNL